MWLLSCKECGLHLFETFLVCVNLLLMSFFLAYCNTLRAKLVCICHADPLLYIANPDLILQVGTENF